MLAVDNFNGAKLLGRTIRCDHCQSYHEEQRKDPNKLPDHVARKLSDKELEQKRRDIEARNLELEEASVAKESLFAVGRGTFESEAQIDERQIRDGIVQARARAPSPLHARPQAWRREHPCPVWKSAAQGERRQSAAPAAHRGGAGA